MAEREKTLIRSPELDSLPGVRHLFVGRAFDGPPDGTAWREAVLEEARRIGGARDTVLLRQVHGNRVVFHPAGGAADLREIEADGAATDRPGLVLAIRVADCLPVYLADRGGRAAALLHAGWRGLAAGILEEGVRSLAGRGVSPDRLVAWIGPSVGPCCYEVGEEVAAAFGADARTRPGGRGRPHLDLYAVARIRLRRAGFGPARIGPRPPCTACDPSRFASHRAEPEHRRRNLALLFLEP